MACALEFRIRSLELLPEQFSVFRMKTEVLNHVNNSLMLSATKS